MGTYTVITITGPNEDLALVKLHKLPDFEGWDGTEWELITTQPRHVIDERVDNRIIKSHYEYDPIPEHRILTSFHTKWEPEGVSAWAEKFTAKRPTLTVQAREEWDNRDADEPGVDDRTYRRGAVVLSESKQNGEIPMNLPELLDQAQQVLVQYGKRDPLQSQSEHYASLAPYLAGSLDALVKGLS